MRFSNFASQNERVAQGLQAYRRAEEVGLDLAEQGVNGDSTSVQAGTRYCRSFMRKVRERIDIYPKKTRLWLTRGDRW